MISLAINTEVSVSSLNLNLNLFNNVILTVYEICCHLERNFQIFCSRTLNKDT